jgi:SAM-dependent methyltransferase
LTSSGPYTFPVADACEMCSAPRERHRLLGRRLNGPQGLSPQRLGGITVSVYQCRECELIFCNPMPVPADLGQHYDVEPEEYWHAEALTRPEGFFGSQIERFRVLWGREGAQPAALDIGCGMGHALLALRESGFDAWGIEPSPAFREAALRLTDLPPERVAQAGVETANFPPGSFDFVNLGAVLEHCYRPAHVLGRCSSWLRPGGLLLVDVPSARYLLHRLLRAAYRVRGLDYVANLSPMHRPFHLYEFSDRSFVKQSAAAGYTVALARYHACRSHIPAWVDRVLMPLMARTGTGMQLEMWLRKPA